MFSRDYSIHDPPLSDLGVEQCAPLRQSLLDNFSQVPASDVAIVVSPMRRTLQTALLAADWLLDRGAKMQANADWQGMGNTWTPPHLAVHV